MRVQKARSRVPSLIISLMLHSPSDASGLAFDRDSLSLSSGVEESVSSRLLFRPSRSDCPQICFDYSKCIFYPVLWSSAKRFTLASSSPRHHSPRSALSNPPSQPMPSSKLATLLTEPYTRTAPALGGRIFSELTIGKRVFLCTSRGLEIVLTSRSSPRKSSHQQPLQLPVCKYVDTSLDQLRMEAIAQVKGVRICQKKDNEEVRFLL